MPQIILTPEQLKVYHEATSRIEICDTYGKVLASFTPDYSKAFIAMLKQRARQPGRTYTSAQVGELMRTLEEVREREGPFDEKRLNEILEEHRAKCE